MVEGGAVPHARMTTAGSFRKAAVVVIHAGLGWAYCGALIGLGRRLLSVHAALVIHAIGAPVGFALISRFYYRRFSYTTPGQTATAFLGVVIALDLFLVAPHNTYANPFQPQPRPKGYPDRLDAELGMRLWWAGEKMK
jgi:hypothetical protein